MLNASSSRMPELVLPVASMAALRRALADAVGEDAAALALREAGRAAGGPFFAALAPRADAEEDAIARGLRDMPAARFWARVAQVFSTRGWGHLAHASPHEGIGALSTTDWVEADPAVAASRPSCFFTTGLLADLLGRTAGAEMAVLEVACRSRGDASCRFLFGSPATLDALFADVAAGRAADDAIATLS